MLANSWMFASAGTPGGYDFSQTFSTVLESIIVAMGGASAGMRKCNLRASTRRSLMATRKKASHSRYSTAAADAGKAVSGSAQKIWLARHGAYERAKPERPESFETPMTQVQ